MTKIEALRIALTTTTDSEAAAVLQKMIDQLSKPRTMSDEAKAKRKEKNAAERAALMSEVLPPIRDALRASLVGLTAKEVYDCAKHALPEDFTANKVQYILLHELADEVIKAEVKGKPNTYRIEREDA